MNLVENKIYPISIFNDNVKNIVGSNVTYYHTNGQERNCKVVSGTKIENSSIIFAFMITKLITRITYYTIYDTDEKSLSDLKFDNYDWAKKFCLVTNFNPKLKKVVKVTIEEVQE